MHKDGGLKHPSQRSDSQGLDLSVETVIDSKNALELFSKHIWMIAAATRGLFSTLSSRAIMNIASAVQRHQPLKRSDAHHQQHNRQR